MHARVLSLRAAGLSRAEGLSLRWQLCVLARRHLRFLCSKACCWRLDGLAPRLSGLRVMSGCEAFAGTTAEEDSVAATIDTAQAECRLDPFHS